jgi:hypothetical protein
VNRHRLHHAFSDHDGDPNKLSDDGFWATMYRCVIPYMGIAHRALDYKGWFIKAAVLVYNMHRIGRSRALCRRHGSAGNRTAPSLVIMKTDHAGEC